MTKLNLRNVDGRIVAEDPETGETRPVSLGDVDAGSVSTEDARTRTQTTTSNDDRAIRRPDTVGKYTPEWDYRPREGLRLIDSKPLMMDDNKDNLQAFGPNLGEVDVYTYFPMMFSHPGPTYLNVVSPKIAFADGGQIATIQITPRSSVLPDEKPYQMTHEFTADDANSELVTPMVEINPDGPDGHWRPVSMQINLGCEDGSGGNGRVNIRRAVACVWGE